MPTETHTIKRYPNRKLYDTSDSNYVTFVKIAALIRAGVELSVVDSETGHDVTAPTLALVLAELAKTDITISADDLVRLIRQ